MPALAVLVVVTLVHLVAQGTAPGGVVADLTQAVLMPALAWVLLTSTPIPRSRLVRLTLLALALSWLGDTLPRFAADGSAVGFGPVEPPVWLARSCCNRRLPTVQPPLSLPSRPSLSAFASVKNVSQNGEAPAISAIGRVSIAGWCMSISMKLMPSCFFAVGSVRTRAPHQSEYWAPEVHVFWPVITQ